MGAYIARRLIHAFIVVWLVSLIIFVVMHMTPGDPILIMLGRRNVSSEQIEIIRNKWGLNDPIVKQYFNWVSNMMRGDFGKSIAYNGMPVRSLILDKIPNTALLNLLAYLIVLIISIPAGIISAVKQYSIFDYSVTSLAVLGISMPNFWLALMLLIVFSLWLGWLPTFGMSSWKSFILPSLSLAAMNAAILTRFVRSNMLEVLREDFVNTARSKGLPEQTVIYKHALRNSALSIVTLVGYRIAYLLSGTVIIETVFAWPGVGRLAVESIFRRDYLVVQAITFSAAIIIVLVNLLTDVTYTYLDPRVRYE